MNSKTWTRRNILKGTGVALALPFLETLAPRTARAAAAAGPKKRYVTMYFPNGTADFWKPSGGGATWNLSAILEPFTPNKAKMMVIQNIGDYSPFGGHIEPSHGHNAASAWTGTKAAGENNSISVDQVIANQIVANNGGTSPTPLQSIQLGLSTLDSSPDGIAAQNSRSMSWKDATTPLYKIVSPQAAFDRLVGSGSSAPTPTGNSMPDPVAERRRLLRKSALDYVIQDATTLQTRLSTSDRGRLDKFLTSVRNLEVRVADPAMAMGVGGNCTNTARPTWTAAVGNTAPDYNRGTHATLMIDLTVMALQCDITRVVSFMLDDARSDYVYNFITERNFQGGNGTSVASTAPVGGYHGLQHAGNTNNGFATIGWWNAQRVNELATKLDAIKEATGGTVLDNTVIHMMSGMHGGNHDGQDLPIAIIGGGGGVLKQNQYINGGGKNLADLHLTIINKVFGGTLAKFGTPMGSFTHGTMIPDILA
jgi:Protein of unknown function (DUF1552)